MRAQAEVLEAVQAKGALGHSDRRAYLGQMKRSAVGSLQDILEAPHDRQALVTWRRISWRLAFGEASDHGEDQFLLDGSGNRWLSNDIRNGRGKIPGRRVQLAQPR